MSKQAIAGRMTSLGTSGATIRARGPSSKHRVLAIGVATREEMKERTMRIARGELKPAAHDPKVWVVSGETVTKLLSPENRALLGVIRSTRPSSLAALAETSRRSVPSLSRTLKSMERLGIVRLDKVEGRLVPHVEYDEVDIKTRF